MGAQTFEFRIRGRYIVKTMDYILGTSGAIVGLKDENGNDCTDLMNEADTSGYTYIVGGKNLRVLHQGAVTFTRLNDDETFIFQEVQREVNRDLNIRATVQNTAPIVQSYDSGTQRLKVSAG